MTEQSQTPQQHTARKSQASMRQLIWPAIGNSFVKLDPRDVARNPVMFVVEIGSVITSIYLVLGLVNGRSDTVFVGMVSGWLWFTVLFANFATAMAEGRGKAQADTLRKTKTETLANVEVDGVVRQVKANDLRKGDVVVVSAGETIPATATSVSTSSRALSNPTCSPMNPISGGPTRNAR